MNQKQALREARAHVRAFKVSGGWVVIKPWDRLKPDGASTERQYSDYKHARWAASVDIIDLALAYLNQPSLSHELEYDWQHEPIGRVDRALAYVIAQEVQS